MYLDLVATLRLAITFHRVRYLDFDFFGVDGAAVRCHSREDGQGEGEETHDLNLREIARWSDAAYKIGNSRSMYGVKDARSSLWRKTTLRVMWLERRAACEANLAAVTGRGE